MNETKNASLRERLQQAFADLHAGRFDRARRAFTELCSQPKVAAESYRGLAAVSWRGGQAPGAIAALRQATSIDDSNVDAHADLALVLTLTGHLQDAIPEWERVVHARPEDADAWHNLGRALGELRQIGPSSQAFEQALRLKPDRLPTLAAYANMLTAGGEHDAAEVVWRRVIEAQPDSPDGYKGLGDAQFQRGNLAGAFETYRAGSQAYPNSPELAMAVGQLHEDFNDRDAAERGFRRALELRPGWPMAVEALLTLIGGKAEPELVEQARAIVKDGRRPPQDRANVGFGLGKVYDAQERYEAAFEIWSEANTARRQQVGVYDHEALKQRVDRLINVFDAGTIERLSGLGNADERPVFIIGMPRSGTSLVEQIIAVHPDATGYGELAEIGRLAREMPRRVRSIQRWPEVMSLVGDAELHAAGSEYLALLQQRQSSEAARLVDKAPLNFFHVGLIALMFPKAHIVWCRRDPRDVCLSIFGQNFALEQKFATDLRDLGAFYREHMRVMRHWESVLPGRIYECHYESFVADIDTQARSLIAALGLPWDDACLRFYEADRPVLTPSRWQVRQPVFASGQGRWRRYERWLRPLVDSLGDEVPS